MNGTRWSKRLFYGLLGLVLILIVKAFVWPQDRGEPLSGVNEINLAIVYVLPLALLLLVFYFFFKITGSNTPTIKDRKPFWQVIGVLSIIILGYLMYLFVAT